MRVRRREVKVKCGVLVGKKNNSSGDTIRRIKEQCNARVGTFVLAGELGLF